LGGKEVLHSAIVPIDAARASSRLEHQVSFNAWLNGF